VTAGLLVALALAAIVIVRLVVYRERHPYTTADLTAARKDAVKRSRSTLSGQVQEHLVPLFPELLSRFNPRDVRFLGAPLDLIVFDGLHENDVRRVVFVEVKTGNSDLQQRERLVRDAIKAGRVEYELLRPRSEVPSPDEVEIPR
jgi:predicted Holliday junction resolvase-like endonuclease